MATLTSTSDADNLGERVADRSDTEAGFVGKAPRFRGVVYDVGLNFAGQGLSVEAFDSELVEHDLRAIARDLHATAVRIEGEDIQRLVTSTRIAHGLGLSVFFNPWKMNADAAELVPYFAQAAREAETLRNEGVDIVFVTGCEYPIFNKGIFPGDTLAERLAWLFAQAPSDGSDPSKAIERFSDKWKDLNRYLGSFVDAVRPEFRGPVTYAATQFEQVDWSLFDIVGVDHYRSNETAEKYVGDLDRYRHGKPLVVMEVGSCAYVGAAKLGGGGFMLLEGTNPDGTGNFRGGVVPVRSELEQADYVETQVRLLGEAGVDGMFVYVFSFPLYPVGEGARDLDMMSFSLVKTYPQDDPRSELMPPWEPKESFHRLAGLYGRMKRIPN